MLVDQARCFCCGFGLGDRNMLEIPGSSVSATQSLNARRQEQRFVSKKLLAEARNAALLRHLAIPYFDVICKPCVRNHQHSF